MFFRKKDKLVDNSIITNYLNLLMELTSIESSKESLDKDIKKEKSGKLLNKYNCKMFSHIKKQYAIRFNDDMNASEFEDVFTLLIKKFGNPSKFSEYHGYVWDFEEYTLTFGLVSLNHCYEVPMIYVLNKPSLFFKSVAFDEFNRVALSFSNALEKRKINPQKVHFYRICYFNEFGYFVIIQSLKKLVSINYKKSTLSITINDGTILDSNDPNKIYKKELKNVSIEKLYDQLEDLLEESESHHQLLID